MKSTRKSSKPHPLTSEQLRELLAYDAGSGDFTWLVSRGSVKRGSRAGSIGTDGRWVISISKTAYRAHQLAWLYVKGQWPEHTIDHRDLNPLNNAFENLRPATRAQNQSNRRCYNKSGFKGVYTFHKKFKAQIVVSGKVHYLGLFSTPEEAHAVYCTAAVEHFGEFARFS